MKRLISTILISILTLLPAMTFAGPAYAACGNSSAAQQVSTGIDETTNAPCNDKQVNNTVATVVNILSLVVGMLSIIVILVSAFKYMTSGGEQNKVANAKSTLIYALVGLAVAGTAQLLVHFVLYQTRIL
ncbi:MAG: pilin [Candidatus Saccharimonadales bacterium]